MEQVTVPSREAWGDLSVDPDVEYGHELFGGKTVTEAAPLFLDNPMERAAELRFTPPAVFNYYVFCFVGHLLGSQGAGQSDMASCFLRLVRDRARDHPATLTDVWGRLWPAVVQVSDRQAFYDADVEIYGAFLALRRDIEMSMTASNDRGA